MVPSYGPLETKQLSLSTFFDPMHSSRDISMSSDKSATLYTYIAILGYQYDVIQLCLSWRQYISHRNLAIRTRIQYGTAYCAKQSIQKKHKGHCISMKADFARIGVLDARFRIGTPKLICFSRLRQDRR